MRLFAIYALAFIVALIASMIVAIGCALVCYGAGFSAMMAGPDALALTVVFSLTGLLLTFRQSFNYVLNAFDALPNEDMEEPDTEALARLEQKPDNPLLRQFDRSVTHYSPAAALREKIKFLSPEEIDDFKKHISTREEKEQAALKKQLEQYELYINNCCGISLEPIKDLKEPVTIEGVAHKPWARTYDKQSIRAWIETKGPHAKEPEINCDLSNPTNKIQIYSGFPEWFCKFIALVRSILEPSKNPAEKIDVVTPSPSDTPSRVLTANHRNAFHAGYPTLFSTPASDFAQPTEQKFSPPVLSIL